MAADNDTPRAELRAEIEELRRSSDAFVTTALDVHRDTFFLFEPATGRALRWNRAFREISGYSDEEIAELPAPASYYGPEDLARAEAFIPRVVADGEGTIELDLICKDGTSVPTEYRVSTVAGSDGELRYLVSIGRDVTERRAAERALRESEERYRLLIENGDLFVSIYDADGVCQFVNANVASWFGGRPDELVGRSFHQLHPEMGEVYSNRVRRVIETGVAESFDDTVSFPRGNRDLISHVLPMRERDGTVVAAQIVSHDVTHLRRLEAQLSRAQQMESVGRLAGGIAHDFNNLLTVIGNAGDLLAEGLGEDHPMAGDVDEIRTAATRAAELTGQLLAFGRRQVVRPRTINLNDTVRTSEPTLRRVIGEDIRIEVDVDPDLPNTHFDPGQAEQILFNLAANAREAMPEGGVLTIETRGVTLAEPDRERHPDMAPGRYVALAVGDTGRGMDEATRGMVFEPFFTTKISGIGAGLGLSVVDGIVAQHDGSVEIDSEPGKGTTVRIFLQVDDRPVEVDVDEAVEQIPADGTTVLLVEDEDSVRRIAHRILVKLGYTVIGASHGKEAIELAGGYDGDIDLVLSDVVMPEMSGPECFARLRRIRPGLKVLFMSGYTENAIAQRGGLDEGTGFIQKPFSIQSLSEAIRRVLDGGED